VAEAGGPASISGAMLNPLDGRNGIFSAEQVEEALRPPDRYLPRSRLVSIEQTTNMGGGRVWPLETIRAVLDVARANDMRAHLDGARLMNAVAASGVSAAEYAGPFDTAWVDFSKGLGAPVGAVLCGSHELIEEAWRYKQMWGGALRQAGVLAAACMYALDQNMERLAEDHANAKRLATGLAELPGVKLDPDAVETNIVIFEVPDPDEFVERAGAEGLQLSRTPNGGVRAVTHLDVSSEQIEQALEIARGALGG
jgi:threonine aldolase